MRLKTSLFLIILFPLVFGMAVTANAKAENPGGKLYTAYNIWDLKDNDMKCINYKLGTKFIAAGTEVSDIKVFEQGQVSSTFNAGFSSQVEKEINPVILFHLPREDRQLRILFYPPWHKGKTVHDYRSMMFTSETFEQQIVGLEDFEVQAIRQGLVADGMTRKAVFLSYGPPPEHATRSLDNHLWTYWLNKRSKRTIYFDNTGRVIRSGYNPSRYNVNPPSKSAEKKAADHLKALKELKDADIITEEEYQFKRKNLVDKL